MPPTSPEFAAKMAELKNAPVRVKQVAACGALLGFLVLLSFCASAFAGYVTWGRALASGVIQFLLLWFVSFAVQDRQKWAWWALIALLILLVWGALGPMLRLVRMAIEGNLVGHGREVLFDVTGVLTLVICGILLGLLLSKQVREYVFKTVA